MAITGARGMNQHDVYLNARPRAVFKRDAPREKAAHYVSQQERQKDNFVS